MRRNICVDLLIGDMRRMYFAVGEGVAGVVDETVAPFRWGEAAGSDGKGKEETELDGGGGRWRGDACPPKYNFGRGTPDPSHPLPWVSTRHPTASPVWAAEAFALAFGIPRGEKAV
jgi:hypothetical protein